jgi:hypothetical protein
MAIIDRPSEDLSFDDGVTNDEVVALAEDGDVEQENIEFSSVVDWVQSNFRKAKDARQTDEERWLMAYRNYRGIYGPEVQFTEEEKSQAFVKITKTKVLAAFAQITDVLFAGNKFPIGIDRTLVPTGSVDAINAELQEGVPDELASEIGMKTSSSSKKGGVRKDILDALEADLAPVEDKLEEGTGATPTSITFDPAQEAGKEMEKKIHDQLGESSGDKHLRSVAFEMCLFGSGIMKGPFAFDKEYPKWDAEGNYTPEKLTIPKIEAVSVWNCYADPDARTPEELEFFIERHKMSRSELRKLKNRPFFREESLELAITYGPDYQPEYWEDILEDSEVRSDTTRYEVLEYWGIIDTEIAEEAGLEIPEELEDKDQIQVNVWVCNDQIIRLVMNPFTPTRIPYLITPYELNPYSVNGVGVAENMEDNQLLMNGFMRMAVDNGALSGNLIIEIDETNLVPGQDMSIYPGKVFRRQAGAPGQAVFGTKFPNVTNECLQMFDKARQLADEATGMPSYSHGQTGVTGIGRTASGMSMLMGAAQQNIKSVVRNIDDYLLTPLGKACFAFNMQFNFDPKYVGDLEVVARGTESLMRNEVRSQRLLQFMQMTANPAMQPFVKYDYILRELAASMDLDESRILNDPRQAAIQAKMMAEIQAMMPPPPPPQQQAGAAPQGQPPAEGAGVPPVADPTGSGNGNIGPGMAPEPAADGFSGNVTLSP